MTGVELETYTPFSSDVRRLSFNIADIRIALSSDDPAMRFGLSGATKLFVSSDEVKPDTTITASWAELDEQVEGEMLFDSGALWQLSRTQDGGYLWRFTTPFFGECPYKIARFNADFSAGHIELHRPYFATDNPVYPLEYPLDELLLLNLLARGRGVEIHSCGVKDKANGFLLAGQSGAGKTTMSRFWEQRGGAEILSDDRIVLRKDGGRFWMYGTPWHGEAEYSCPLKTPLTQIFFLHQGGRNELRPLTRAEAAARLFACSFPTYHDTSALEFTLQFFDQVTEAVECQELSFVRDAEVVDFIRSRAAHTGIER